MAAVNVPVKGLTGLITIFAYADDAVTTIADVLASIVAADGITAGYYYNLALVRDTSKDNLTTPTATLSSLNFVGATGTNPFTAGAIVSETFDNGTQTTIPATDIFIIKPAQAFWDVGATDRQFNQVERLNTAQLKRQGGPTALTTEPFYRTRNTYDITSLPTQYNGNTVVVNPNLNGLLLGRPWVATSANPTPSGIDDAVGSETLLKLEGQFEATETTTLIPGTNDGSQITQWTDQSSFSHNLNATGGNKPKWENTDAPNSTPGYVYYDGTDCQTINPIANLASVDKVTMLIAFKVYGSTGFVINGEDQEVGIFSDPAKVSATMGGAISGTVYTPLAADTWTVATIIFDGTQTGNANRLKLRLNSVDQTLTFIGTVPTTTSASTNSIYVGCDSNGTNFSEQGVGAVYLFIGDTLSAVEIQNVENLLTNTWL
mgnify:CR=1 FL=1